MRSYGLLKYAAKMNTEEAMNCLSFLLLGVSMGMLSPCSTAALNNLMMDIMPAMLGTENGTAEERDTKYHFVTR